ncbi:MAG: methyltransferase domain-containing protein [Acetobacteraceae bacterium]|nr:methyltransferase domain-containing protein [Acetobacteraceae bacterium]
MTTTCCRSCAAPLTRSFVDLGRSPLANSFIKADGVKKMECFFPLHAFVCDSCFLVQLEDYESPENIFSDYLYFSSYSQHWLAHCKAYAAEMTQRYGLGPSSLVVEIASNDGYLLQYFKESGVGVLGVEPAANVAKVAIEKGIRTDVAFFGVETARRLVAAGHRADLTAANNVLAHVPDINDFVGGFKILLKPTGVCTFEFPHLLQLIQQHQFDTIYHEHFSYLSLIAIEKIFARQGLAVYDVELLTTHGGSLRVFATHADTAPPATDRLKSVRAAELTARLDHPAGYENFADEVAEVKCQLLEFLIDARRAGKTVVGYGAPAKGNTLLNYCGVGTELIQYTVDASPHKQGMFLPGVQIPIHAPQKIFDTRPDYVLILPWNLKDEISTQMAGIRDWGGRFVVAIPKLTIQD